MFIMFCAAAACILLGCVTRRVKRERAREPLSRVCYRGKRYASRLVLCLCFTHSIDRFLSESERNVYRREELVDTERRLEWLLGHL